MHFALLLLIIAGAAALRLWRIDGTPPGFHFDESFEGLEAWRILTEPGYRPIFLVGNFGVPPLNAYANALTFFLFERLGGEAGPTAMRITAALFGVLGVLAVYALALELVRLANEGSEGSREQSGEHSGLSAAFPLLAAAALAGMRWHIHFSRMGIEPILVPAIWAAATWLLLRARRTGEWVSYVGCGILLAAAMYTYQAAWIVPFVVAFAALHLLIANPLPKSKSRRIWTGLALAAGISILLVAPLAIYLVQQFDLLLLRPMQTAIVGDTASPADSSLAANARAYVAMFGPLGAPGDLDPRRNIPGAPAITPWLALPFWLGAALALLRVLRPAYSIPLIGLIGLLLPGVVSEYAPHFHRILGASAPTALLIGLGLDTLWRLPARLRVSRPLQMAARGLALLLLTAGIVASAYDYFGRWATRPDLFHAFDAGLWEVGRWVADQRSGSTIYITPRGEEHATLAFAWRTTPMPQSFDGRHIFPLTRGVNEQPEHYVVIEDEDFRTRLLLPEIFPNATIDYTVPDESGNVYANVYTRPAGTEAQRPPQFSLDENLGDGIALLGYDLLPAEPRVGEILYLQLHWSVTARPAHDWTVFTHVVDPTTGAVVAGHDSSPGAGSLPTTRWLPDQRILDEVQIALPSDLPPARYLLRAGLYRAMAGALWARLPADGESLGPGIDLGETTIAAQP